MKLKTFKPATPSLRYQVSAKHEEITQKRPYKPLTVGWKRIGGRGAKGRISMRRRGGGHKQRYRIIDFRRNKLGIPAQVKTVEYDPKRTGLIALLSYADGEKRYILAPEGLKPGDHVVSGPDAPDKIGCAKSLDAIPVGTVVHNVELKEGGGGVLVRSAGSGAQILAVEGDYAQLRMPSGEVRLVFKKCFATIGKMSFPENLNVRIGKAGRNRWLGRRPKVRGSAMNPVDHPHGGGEGKAGQGNPHPVSPEGKPAKGKKTRRRKRTSRFILSRRKK